MRQKKHGDISRNIQIYIKEKDSIENKQIILMNCINEINNFKDWIIWWIEEEFNKLTFYTMAKNIANANKHYKLRKNWKTINDFIKIKTTNELLLKRTIKKLDKDLIMTRDNKIKEYKYIEIDMKMTAYEFLDKCLEEIHDLIQNNFNNKDL